MQPYRLVSFKLCPHVQRSLIVLEEHAAPYEVERIDPSDPPGWFVLASPLGKVPMLLVGQVSLFESAVINEYIDETAPGDPLLPAEPLPRALQRAWVAVTSELLSRIQALSTAATQEEARAVSRGMTSLLEQLQARVRQPWFDGQRFSMVDAAVAPALQRLSWCEELAPSLNILQSYPAVRAWRDALLDRDSVRRSTAPGLFELFVEMLRGRATPRLGTEPSWLGRLSLST